MTTIDNDNKAEEAANKPTEGESLLEDALEAIYGSVTTIVRGFWMGLGATLALGLCARWGVIAWILGAIPPYHI